MAEINHAFAISVASVSQHAALAAMTGPQDCVEEMRRTYDERRKAMCEGLKAIGIPYAEPQGAFYVYANFAVTGMPASEFCQRLLAEGRVMIYPGIIYGDHTDDFVRMSLTQPVERIKEAMARIAAVVTAINTERKSSAA
jgi:aspartate/methionine/tyrosine aminotransferase